MKPLKCKNYGSIPHLLQSKLGVGDYHIHSGQNKIFTEKTRDKNDLIIVTEKYDGSNVGVCNVEGNIYAITRSGYLAETSPYPQHHYFKKWVEKNKNKFKFLRHGERIVGEWMLQSSSLIYNIQGKEPFVAFDLFYGKDRVEWDIMEILCLQNDILTARVLHRGSSISIDDALSFLWQQNDHPIQTENSEGMVYRCERNGKVDFLGKYVRHDFIAGQNLFSDEPVYNIDPKLIL